MCQAGSPRGRHDLTGGRHDAPGAVMIPRGHHDGPLSASVDRRLLLLRRTVTDTDLYSRRSVMTDEGRTRCSRGGTVQRVFYSVCGKFFEDKLTF